MYRDLYDKFKHRTAFISEEYDYLYFAFEFRGSALPFNREKILDKQEDFFDGELRVYLENNKKLVFQIQLKQPDLSLLYKVSIVMAYIVGKNVSVQYYYKNFPYYPTDHYFNLHSRSPLSNTILQSLLDQPTKTITSLLDLLDDNSSYFNKLVVGIMEVNAISYPEFIFVYEYGLLQGLAAKNPVSGNLFSKNDEQFKKLEDFSVKAQELLEEYPELCEKIKNKLDTRTLNARSSWKEKIKIFLNQSGDKRLQGYVTFVDDWNSLRNSTTAAHGSNSLELDQKNIELMNKLHEFLLELISKEVHEKIKVTR